MGLKYEKSDGEEKRKIVSKQEIEDLEQLLSSVVLRVGGGELYHQQYNEHGVQIEQEISDTELFSRYN